MKKIWILLLSIVFIYGCGSGGGTSGTPTSSPGSSPVSGQAGTFTITLNDGGAVSSTSRHSLSINSGAADHARVVIRQVTKTSVPIYETDEEGNSTGVITGYKDVISETYRRVVDAPISAGQVTVTAPAGIFTFDVLTYIAGPPNTMLKFGHAENVPVANGGNLSLPINDICADPSVSLGAGKVGSVVMQIPTSIISEQSYSVTANATTPIRNTYQLGIALSASGTVPANTYALSTSPLTIYGKANLTAPTSTAVADTSLLFTIKYFISDDMLDMAKNESFKDWVRIYPNNVGTSGESLASNFAPLLSITVPTP